MKQIISFKKELPFKTKVSDITSISLERDLKVEDDGIITGVFHITGDYKMNEGSINRENFSFDLPFDITLDPRYDTSTVEADIEDFYYDIINNDTLKVNIDLYIEAEYLPEDNKEIIEDVEDINEEENNNDEDISLDIEPVNVKEEEFVREERNEPSEELPKEDINEIVNDDRDDDFQSDLFSNLDNSETYVI